MDLKKMFANYQLHFEVGHNENVGYYFQIYSESVPLIWGYKYTTEGEAYEGLLKAFIETINKHNKNKIEENPLFETSTLYEGLEKRAEQDRVDRNKLRVRDRYKSIVDDLVQKFPEIKCQVEDASFMEDRSFVLRIAPSRIYESNDFHMAIHKITMEGIDNYPDELLTFVQWEDNNFEDLQVVYCKEGKNYVNEKYAL